MKCERSWAVSDPKRILSGHPGMKHFWLLSRLLPTSWIYLFWPLRTMLFQALLLRGRLLSLTYLVPPGSPSLLEASWLEVWAGAQQLLHSPLLPSAACSKWLLALQAQLAPEDVIPIVSLLFPLSSAKVYNLINLPEIPFHMKSSSIAAVRCTDWSQTAWVLFQRCHLWTVWSWAS